MTIFNSWKKKLAACMCAGIMAVVLCVPATALAATYPGVDQATSFTTGNTAETAVGLKADEQQLSFSASTVINFAMNADGTFQVPTANEAKISNNSIFDIKVSQYEVTSDDVANGVAEANFEAATGDNTYAITVTPSNSGAASCDFAVSNTAPSATDWNIAKKSGTTATDLGLTFSNGHMKNVTSGTWGTGHNLQKVVWTVAVA